MYFGRNAHLKILWHTPISKAHGSTNFSPCAFQLESLREHKNEPYSQTNHATMIKFDKEFKNVIVVPAVNFSAATGYITARNDEKRPQAIFLPNLAIYCK